MSIKISIGKEEYFPQVKRIKYEGPNSSNPLSFKYYDSEKIIAGKPMKDHFRFATAYWHTFCGQGSDPFGPGTQNFPWDPGQVGTLKGEVHRKEEAFQERWPQGTARAIARRYAWGSRELDEPTGTLGRAWCLGL